MDGLGDPSIAEKFNRARPAIEERDSEGNLKDGGFDVNSASYFDRELLELARMPSDNIGTIEQRPAHKFDTGSIYTGQWCGNQRHGFGSQKWCDGATYEGQWKDNKAEGLGRFMHSDGDTYIGQWKANVAHGKGIYYHKDLTTYEGEWKHDLQEGYGVETWAEGTRFKACSGVAKKSVMAFTFGLMDRSTAAHGR